MKFRIKCPHCGEVQDVVGPRPCKKCGQTVAPLNQAGIQLYRLGNFNGVAAGFGVYLNGQPYGHIANKESVFYSLPYGTYTVHITCNMWRDCDDVTVTLTPQAPVLYCKTGIKTGFWKNRMELFVCNPSEMPPLD